LIAQPLGARVEPRRSAILPPVAVRGEPRTPADISPGAHDRAEAYDPAIGGEPTQILNSAPADVCPDRLDGHADALITEPGQANRRMCKCLAAIFLSDMNRLPMGLVGATFEIAGFCSS
jgi:hypothetical protein